MKIPEQFILPKQRLRLYGLTAIAALLLIIMTGCAVQESNTYPIETFSEMHYAQSHRAQEPTRLNPNPEAVPFVSANASEAVQEISESREEAYDTELASDLYRINCSVCHGISGEGDGPVALHLIAPDSNYASRYGEPYKGPANLIEVIGRYEGTEDIGQDYIVITATNGICSATPNPDECIEVMPAFENLLSEEELIQIAIYVFDEQAGLGSIR